jgi:cytochrome c biogenesis protein CcdA
LRLAIPQVAHRKIAVLMEKASVPTALALGALVGLCEFPCTGGPYLMVLGLLHDHSTYYTGAAYLTMYNLIFVLPLVLILLIASDNALLAKVQAWQQGERRVMRWGGGAAMVALGALIFAF